jgi:hypothetical protein
MKTDLTTSILAAVIGIVVAYFVCNMFIPGIDDVSIKTLGNNLNYSLTEPNPEIFNYRAVNPTVEVYVGQCKEYDQNGNCVEQVKSLDETDVTNTENTEKTEDSDKTDKTDKTDTETDKTNTSDSTEKTEDSTNSGSSSSSDSTTPEPVNIPEETR